MTAVGRSENTGTVYNATRTLLKDSGRAPILTERIYGALKIKDRKGKNVNIYALESNGERAHRVNGKRAGANIEIPLHHAHNYEIIFLEA